ncbi:MAG: DUF438 domain-containing protein [Selenomonadaceae bacterium]|nr:DUF438 domain-containing protein [Selenomonadaceae bacterium]
MANVQQSERLEKLQTMLARLGKGEDLEAVRKDFVRDFEHVSVQEIMDAEQHMIADGTDISDVQKLCDLHAALFHGRTEAEVLQDEARKTHEAAAQVNPDDIETLAEAHPLRQLSAENTALAHQLDEVDALTANPDTDPKACVVAIQNLNGIWSHYGKKEELLMPLLYSYGVTGPSQVMWGVDDEMKRELSTILAVLREDPENLTIYHGRIQALSRRIREMIYKEERILFPLAYRFFSEEEWYKIYHDFPEYGMAFGVPFRKWAPAIGWKVAQQSQSLDEQVLDGKIHTETGELTLREFQRILALMPVDITFVDADNIVRFFVNNGHVFSRPKSCLGRDIFEVHPPQIIPVVRQLLEDFRAGKRDDMLVYRRIKGAPIGVHYLAVRSAQDEYLGTVEFVTDYSEALEKFSR